MRGKKGAHAGVKMGKWKDGVEPLGYLLVQMAALLVNKDSGKRIKESTVKY